MTTDWKQSQLGGSSVDTYLNRPSVTKYEKFIEAYYFFNKDKKSKQQCDLDGKAKWRKIKSDQVSVENYLRKHQQLLQKEKKQFFFPIKRKDKNTEADSSKGNRTELDAIDSRQAIKSHNLHELNSETRSDFIHLMEVAVIRQFLTQLDYD